MQGELKISLEDFLNMRDENLKLKKEYGELRAESDDLLYAGASVWFNAVIELFKNAPKYKKGDATLDVKFVGRKEAVLPTKVILELEEDQNLRRDILKVIYKYGKKS